MGREHRQRRRLLTSEGQFSHRDGHVEGERRHVYHSESERVPVELRVSAEAIAGREETS